MASKTYSPVGIDFELASTSPVVALNTVAQSDLFRGVYVMAASAVAQFDVVSIDGDGLAIPITTTSANLGHRIGFSQVAIAASSFAPVATTGVGMLIAVAALAPIATRLFTTNTAWRVRYDTCRDYRRDNYHDQYRNGHGHYWYC